MAWVSDPVTFSAQTSWLPCWRLNLGPPAAREGFQLLGALPTPGRSGWISPVCRGFPAPSAQHPGLSGTAQGQRPRGSARATQRADPEADVPPRYTAEAVSAPGPLSPRTSARGSAPPACLALPSRPPHPLAQGIWSGLCIRKITAAGWRLD